MLNKMKLFHVALIVMVVVIIVRIYKRTFVETFEASDKELIFVFADWCGYCTRFKPTWVEIESYSKKNRTFKTIALNADHGPNKPLLEHYNVKSFPTLIVRRGNDHKLYDGERTKENIQYFAENF